MAAPRRRCDANWLTTCVYAGARLAEYYLHLFCRGFRVRCGDVDSKEALGAELHVATRRWYAGWLLVRSFILQDTHYFRNILNHTPHDI